MSPSPQASTNEKIDEILDTLRRYGGTSIVALAGVPGTGKSYIAEIAAQRFTNEPLRVRVIQFHQSYSYEEFMEGLRINSTGAVVERPGVFLEWNQQALDDDSTNKYVLLIEELTRANISAVLGELLTYVEHRKRSFLTTYSRRPVAVAPNISILATYNPTDRSAIEIDAALLRRLRIINCPPSRPQLREMLNAPPHTLSDAVISKLERLFEACEEEATRINVDYEDRMPFGHGIFSEVMTEVPDLYRLWQQRLVHLLGGGVIEKNEFADVIAKNFPWKASASYTLPLVAPMAPPAATVAPAAAGAPNGGSITTPTGGPAESIPDPASSGSPGGNDPQITQSGTSQPVQE